MLIKVSNNLCLGEKMTKEELDIALMNLGLQVPETERADILNAVKYIEEMKTLVRKPRFLTTEPANTIAFPKLK